MCLTALTRIRKALENRTNMEDDRVAILEAQLSQAKLIAEESDKKYEEVNVTPCFQLPLFSKGAWYDVIERFFIKYIIFEVSFLWTFWYMNEKC